jgi:two-component system response regulator AtoC
MLNEFGRVGKGNAIAIVEDDEEMREMLADFLAYMGYEVHAYPNAKEFLEVVGGAKRYFSVVISDVHMDGINGLEMLGRLREIDLFIPALMMTSAPNTRDRKLAESLGAAAYLRKPFTLAELITHVRKATSLAAVAEA